MATISVPLSPKLEMHLDELIADGMGANRADVMRKALEQFIEDTAVLMVLKAQSEPSIRGNARELLARMSD